MSSDEKLPQERKQTLRDALYHELKEGPQTVRELSILIGAQQKDVLDHLAHLERSLARSDEVLLVKPAQCLACGFEFEDRSRLSKPGRCPACKSTRITLPRFAIRPR